MAPSEEQAEITLGEVSQPALLTLASSSQEEAHPPPILTSVLGGFSSVQSQTKPQFPGTSIEVSPPHVESR